MLRSKLLALILCLSILIPAVDIQAAEKSNNTTSTKYDVSSLAEANAAIYDSLNQHASKMILNLGKDMDYYETYDLIVPYTRGLGTYNTHNFGYAVNGGTWTRLEINVRYYTTEAEEQILDKALDDLLPTFNQGSNYDKIKSVHDYICNVTNYSDKTANNVAGYNYHSAYDALFVHEAVCSGYALLFQKIMEKLEIPCFMYIDENEVAHAWNIVYLDGSWYQVDCTWDDKTNGYSYEYFLKGTNLKNHTYEGEVVLSKTDYTPVNKILTKNK